MSGNNLKAEKIYNVSLRDAQRAVKRIGQADIVAGIPFRNEADTIGHVCETVIKGLSEFYPEKRCVVVGVGAFEGKEALELSPF